MKKKTGTGYRIIWAMQAIMELVTAGLLWKLDMLPMKFFVPVLVVLALMLVLTRTMMFYKAGKWERNARKVSNALGCVIAVVCMVLCGFASHMIFTVNHTFGAITNNEINAVVGVYVLADDPAQNIQDAADYTFVAIRSFDADAVDQAVSKIEQDVGVTLNIKSFDTSFAAVDALYSGEIGAIVMSESYLDVLEEMGGYSDFAERTRLLDTHIVEQKVDKDQNGEDAPVTPVVKDPTKEPFLLYISGNDARREMLANGASDVNILVAVDPVNKQILMVNTPRDYFVANPAGDGAKDKLTLCGMYGIENSVQAMSLIYDQPISYYAKINFSGFRTLVDAMGGVTIYSDISFTTGAGEIYAGENTLNGTQALAFARERKHLTGGDNDRGKNQMKLITAMINKLSSGTILTNYAQILGSLEGMFTTSMPLDTISDLVKMQLNDMASWNIYSYAVTGDNGSDQPYSQDGLYAYVMYPHEQKVQKASELMSRVLDGQLLSEEDLKD